MYSITSIILTCPAHVQRCQDTFFWYRISLWMQSFSTSTPPRHHLFNTKHINMCVMEVLSTRVARLPASREKFSGLSWSLPS